MIFYNSLTHPLTTKRPGGILRIGYNITFETCSGENEVSANALARAGSSASRAAASSSLFLGDAATALIQVYPSHWLLTRAQVLDVRV